MGTWHPAGPIAVPLFGQGNGLQARLIKLQEQERSKSAAMARRQGQLATTLSALQRMARMPAATLVAIRNHLKTPSEAPFFYVPRSRNCGTKPPLSR